ncbi:uncharacterized protein LOC135384622 [Ornithodoros turicata]|uniref:uncharacterized protein LOC135384622 n=1 Tax=Ornithodoros turicata TaxID=34597 RepID=UPI003139D6F7
MAWPTSSEDDFSSDLRGRLSMLWLSVAASVDLHPLWSPFLEDLAITEVWRRMNQHFELKDLGHVCRYLGIEIERPQEDCFLLHQRNKIDALLEKYHLSNAKEADGLVVAAARLLAVALSSTEAECVSAAYASQEVLWLRELLAVFGQVCERATYLIEDNQGCIKLALSDGISAITKHIDVRHDPLRDLVARTIVELQCYESSRMTADALTKPLPIPRLEALRQQMGLVIG